MNSNNRLLRKIAFTLLCSVATVFFGSALNARAQTGNATTLEKFYVHYKFGRNGVYDGFNVTVSQLKYSLTTDSPAFLSVGTFPTHLPVDASIAITTQFLASQIEFFGDLTYRACPREPLLINRFVSADTSIQIQSAWWLQPPPWTDYTDCASAFFNPANRTITYFTDTITFTAPQRRKAVDGGQYDASAMRIVRNGVPWLTYHWGYQLGLVASTSDWDNTDLARVPDLAKWSTLPSKAQDLELTSLPSPVLEDNVVEYVNKRDFPKQPGGQFFYAVLAADKAALDAVPAWQRTGKSFKSGGYVSVCRFYGGKNGGPNTHFYSADDKECAALKSVPVLSYEGQTFAVNMPMPGANADGTKPCPIDSKPLYRLYNNASAPGKDYVSNHRYVTERSDVTAAVAQGWVDEGQVMCVPL